MRGAEGHRLSGRGLPQRAAEWLISTTGSKLLTILTAAQRIVKMPGFEKNFTHLQPFLLFKDFAESLAPASSSTVCFYELIRRYSSRRLVLGAYWFRLKV